MNAMTPRLNQQSLIQMAIRHKKSIKASGYKSSLLSRLSDFLQHSIEELNIREYSSEELNTVEKDLEILEAALTHLWISVPYNQSLTIPKNLEPSQIERIYSMTKPALAKGHLRLAHSSAA